MLSLLLGVLLVSLLGMFLIPLRHLPRVRSIEDIDFAGDSESVVRAPVIGMIQHVEMWYQGQARQWFLKKIDKTLKVFEYSAGRLAGQAKSLRFIVQEHFKVIPRESLYWKQIHSWKKTNGHAHMRIDTETRYAREEDISNHSR